MTGHQSEGEVLAAVEAAHRGGWAIVLAATVRGCGDLDLAQECVQDAYARALTVWAERGVPDNPIAWLTTVAKHRVIDQHRRAEVRADKLPLLVEEVQAPDPADQVEQQWIPDDRLRLIFVCCHPALARPAQAALTLRLVCGLTTAEVARAFLVQESTMAARITRAKKKISAARIPYRVPPPDELPARIDAVLTVLHLLFSTGHTAPAGPTLVRADLLDRALDLARMLRTLLPADPGVAGLLALILFAEARKHTRTDPDGRLLLLEEQDRTRWDADAIAEAESLTRESLRSRPVNRFALHAAIAGVHAQAPSWADTDWRELVALYDLLLRGWPSPVVALNRAVAVSFLRGPEAGLAELEPLAEEPQLAGYPYLAATRADLLRRLGRTEEARLAYGEALLLTENQTEREFLAGRLDQLG
ncbi:MAG TPA: sigma-70 family RNA polymerase sigma factor [Pseudonocardiaceae bacterium]|nr:sigma-70 family RNA polymerase sigma factor [Pseudonocardiaceae bacterium]